MRALALGNPAKCSHFGRCISAHISCYDKGRVFYVDGWHGNLCLSLQFQKIGIGDRCRLLAVSTKTKERRKNEDKI